MPTHDMCIMDWLVIFRDAMYRKGVLELLCWRGLEWRPQFSTGLLGRFEELLGVVAVLIYPTGCNVSSFRRPSGELLPAFVLATSVIGIYLDPTSFAFMGRSTIHGRLFHTVDSLLGCCWDQYRALLVSSVARNVSTGNQSGCIDLAL